MVLKDVAFPEVSQRELSNPIDLTYTPFCKNGLLGLCIMGVLTR